MNVRFLIVGFLVACLHGVCFPSTRDLAVLTPNQQIGDLRLSNLYSDVNGQIVGAKFWHYRSGAPIYLFQIETVPQVFMWVDTPAESNAGLAHSLEHLLASKGTKGRYVNLLKEMRLSRSAAATTDDFNLYSFSSGTGLLGFCEQFHAWLDALYKPDFTNLEAEREFYHFGTSLDPVSKTKSLIEQGTVYSEMQSGQGGYSYYFELNRRVFGKSSPFGFYGSGVPADMRQVKPPEIRRFYSDHYRLGPTTGFIFALSPNEDARKFLERISTELTKVTASVVSQGIPQVVIRPKYTIQPSEDTQIAIIPFASSGEGEPGEVRFGWKPVQARSQTELKLLQLLLRALGDGEKSLLHKGLIDSTTQEFDSGATNVESLVFLGDSPWFPAEFIGFSGIPGNKLSIKKIQELRSSITATIQGIAQYEDHSPGLAAFNRLVLSYAKAWHRSQNVRLKSAPRFGFGYETDWKEYLEYLEMDPSFVRSISDEPSWKAVEKRMHSGENIWRDLIVHFKLLDVPYATASLPSPQLMRHEEDERQKRIADKLKELMNRYRTRSEEDALNRFEQEENAKTKEIDQIAARVPRASFTDSPPLTADDDIRYRQFQIHGVPTTAAFFPHAPTIDLGLSFDLRKVPRKYHKYLPIFPRCLDSIGLKSNGQITSYSDFRAQVQSELNDLLVNYDLNPVSHRAELRIQASTLTPTELRRALQLIERMFTLNNLDVGNLDRLRDVVERRRWEDDSFDKGDDDNWFVNPSRAFRYQNDPLYLALYSAFTRAHWDDRLMWLLHPQVQSEQIARLGAFADTVLSSSSGLSGQALIDQLNKSKTNKLEGELVEYWQKNIPKFPPDQVLDGLRRLAREVQEDLATGPEKTIADLRELQRIAINRRALRIDLTLDRAELGEIEPALANFLNSILDSSDDPGPASGNPPESNPVLDNVKRRYKLDTSDPPWYIGFEDSRGTTASMVFFADSAGYEHADHKSLVRQLASNMAAGAGPHTFYMKAQEDGLADGSSIYSDPRVRLLRFYAARTPDITALIQLVNSTAQTLSALRDPTLVDYALQETFPIPRSMATFTERGKGIASDIQDGIDPTVVRRFSQALLRLRGDPNLLSEITSNAMEAVCPVLIKTDCRAEQQESRSLFFFVGSERFLSDAERKLVLPKLLRAYPSDFWIDDPTEAEHETASSSGRN